MLIAEDHKHHRMDGWDDEVPSLRVGEEIEDCGEGHQNEAEDREN